MLKRRIALLIISTFLFLNVSCSSQSNQDTDDHSISIYLWKYDKFSDDALLTYDGVRIKAKYYTDRSELYNKLPLELLAGEGPDIIKIERENPLSVPKLFSSGILTVLNELINEDKQFNLTDYNKVVLDSGVSGGKRYLIPTGFIAPFFYSTSSIIEKNGINIDINNWSWETMVKVADDFHQQNRATGKYLFQLNQYPIMLFRDLLTASGFRFIDYKNCKSYFDSPEFIEFLIAFKEKIYPVLFVEKMNTGDASLDSLDLLKDEKVVMLYNFVTLSPQRLSVYNKNIQDNFNEDMVIFPIPSYKGGSGIVVQPQEAIGINSKCKYKKAAFEYIKRFLSKEHHKQHYEYIRFTTVNNEALLEEGKFCTNEPNLHLPVNLLNSFDSIMANVNKSVFKDISLYEIYMKEVEDYLKGKKTAEQTAKIIDDKVAIFLYE